MKRRNNFLQQLQKRRQEAATTAPKPLSEMSEAELDRELEQTKAALRNVKEQELTAAREAKEQASSSGNQWAFPRRKTRRPWK